MIIVYPIGIPLVYFMLLYSKHAILSNEEVMMIEAADGYPNFGYLKFLVDAYKPKYYYFEVVDVARRLLLASIIGMFPADSPVSASVGFLICLFFNWLFVETKPFKEYDNSQLSINLSHSLTIMFFAALLVKVDATDENGLDQTVLGLILTFSLWSGPAYTLLQSTQVLIYNVLDKFVLKQLKRFSNRTLASASNPNTEQNDAGGKIFDEDEATLNPVMDPELNIRPANLDRRNMSVDLPFKNVSASMQKAQI